MDFSTSSYGKKKLSETNYAPVPPAFREALLKTGILFHVYYDNYPTAHKPFNETGTTHTETRRFPFYCLLQLLGGDGFFYDAAHRRTEFLNREQAFSSLRDLNSSTEDARKISSRIPSVSPGRSPTRCSAAACFAAASSAWERNDAFCR